VGDVSAEDREREREREREGGWEGGREGGRVRGREGGRPREYLATGASTKYASRIRGGSTLFARQLYFLFANKCVPLKIIFNVHVMWSPRDGCEEGIF